MAKNLPFFKVSKENDDHVPNIGTFNILVGHRFVLMSAAACITEFTISVIPDKFFFWLIKLSLKKLRHTNHQKYLLINKRARMAAENIVNEESIALDLPEISKLSSTRTIWFVNSLTYLMKNSSMHRQTVFSMHPTLVTEI